jgi:four helix bundle protein
MAHSIICERAFEFAHRILKLGERLWNRGPAARQIAAQLLRCGSSIGSNAEEAQEAQTKADFIAKMSISRKEAREAHWWLRLAVKAEVVTANEVSWESQECYELLLMIRSAIRTAQSSPTRSPTLEN